MPLPAGNSTERQECLNAAGGPGHRCNLPVEQFAEHTYQSLKTHTASDPVMPLPVILPK